MVELKDCQQQDGGQAAVPLTPNGDRIHVYIFTIEGSYTGDLLYCKKGTDSSSTRLLPFFLLSTEELPVLK